MCCVSVQEVLGKTKEVAKLDEAALSSLTALADKLPPDERKSLNAILFAAMQEGVAHAHASP